jgi:flagellar biosynthesis component FlhA
VLGRGSVSGRGTGYEDALVLEAFRAVMDHAEHLVDLQDLDAWLDRARERRPAVAATACAVAAPAEMLRLVRGLLRERIALPPFEAVLEALAQSSAFAAGSDKARWLECLREELAGYWVRDLLDALARVGAPVWIRVDPGLEDALLDAGRTEGETFVPALSPKARQAWLETVLTARGDAPALVVCGPAARAAFAALLRSVRPHVPVLSIRELERAGLEPPEDARWTPRSV